MGRAAALVFSVVAVHAWLLGAAAPPVSGLALPAMPPSLTVRQIAANPPAAAAVATAAAREAAAAPVPVPIRLAQGAPTAAPHSMQRGDPAAQRTEPVTVAAPRIDSAPGAAEQSAAVEDERSTGIEPDVPQPVYATRVPLPAELRYSLRRGTATGEALLSWRVESDRYELLLQATLPSGASLEQRSLGGFDAAGLAPVRLADRRRGRDQRAANFQRERGLITFSGSRAEFPVVAGAQDRLTWLVQLAAIAAAAPQGLPEGAEVSMLVVGARGAASRWRFQVRSMQTVEWSQGTSDALWLSREPQHPYDLRVEVWLDPARGFWPLRVRQTQIPGGEATEWLLSEEPRPGPGT